MKINRWFYYLLGCLLCLNIGMVQASSLAITGLRVTANQDGTARLVFEMNARPSYVLFKLSNPERLVLDIKNAHLKQALSKNTFSATPIKDIRSGMHNADTLRIVMDLQQKVVTKDFVLTSPKSDYYRLVIDIKSKKGVASFLPISKNPSNPLAALPAPTIKLKRSPVVAPTTKLASTQPSVSSTQNAVSTAPLKPLVIGVPHRQAARDIIIVIDPGHGGKDPGTTGPGGVHEKDVVLAISKYLQQELNSEPGFHAELTRNSDYYIPLRGRLDIARKDKADMFIAIHADAYKNKDALGASVFALSERGATSEAARWLAEKENRSELLGGASLPDRDNILRSVLIDLSQTNTISESLQIGTSVLQQLSHVTVLHHAQVEQAAFVVLKSPDIPSLLVETGFLSTPQQERQLRNPQYQQRLADAIMQGIKSYFVRYPPPGTMLAAQRGNNQFAAND